MIENSTGVALFKFQIRAIEQELIRSWKGYNKALVITAGTGMGKTIALSSSFD